MEKPVQEKFDAPLSNSFEIFTTNKFIAGQYGYEIQPSFLDPKPINWLRENFIPEENDVFLATYPKSGTTWVQKLCLEIMNCSYENKANISNHKYYKSGNWRYFPYIEAIVSQKGINAFKQQYEQFDNNDTNSKHKYIRFWKTHANWSLVPCNINSLIKNQVSLDKQPKFIVVSREPKDVMVSSYEFYRREASMNYGGDFNDYFNIFMCGMLPFGSWFDWIAQWYRTYKSGKYNVLWVYYEDLIDNTIEQAIKISKFLGEYEYLGHNDKERLESIKIIVKKSSFKNMKQMVVDNKVELSVGASFFRKGKIGDWKNYMNNRQANIVDNMIRCRFYESDFKYYEQLKQKMGCKMSTPLPSLL